MIYTEVFLILPLNIFPLKTSLKDDYGHQWKDIQDWFKSERLFEDVDWTYFTGICN